MFDALEGAGAVFTAQDDQLGVTVPNREK